MSPATKIRLGAGLLIAGEIGGLVSQGWPRASTFLGFALGAGALLAAGAAIGTWGLVRGDDRGQGRAPRRGGIVHSCLSVFR